MRKRVILLLLAVVFISGCYEKPKEIVSQQERIPFWQADEYSDLEKVKTVSGFYGWRVFTKAEFEDYQDRIHREKCGIYREGYEQGYADGRKAK